MIEVVVDDKWIRDFIHYGKRRAERVFYSQTIPEVIFAEIIRISPYYTGQFRSQWKMVNQGKGAIAFTNASDYAQVIDEGGYRGVGPRTVRGRSGGIFSKQAPQGITYPIIKEFGQERISPKLKKRIGLLLTRALGKWGFSSV